MERFTTTYMELLRDGFFLNKRDSCDSSYLTLVIITNETAISFSCSKAIQYQKLFIARTEIFMKVRSDSIGGSSRTTVNH